MKNVERQKMFKITITGYGFPKLQKSDIGCYPLAVLLDPAQKIESDERFHPIGKVIGGLEFSEHIEIILGVFSSRPLFIKVSRMGNLYFSEFCNEENEGFSMFSGNAEIPKKKKYFQEIHDEFLRQFQIFLEKKSHFEFLAGIKLNEASQTSFRKSRSIGRKLLLF